MTELHDTAGPGCDPVVNPERGCYIMLRTQKPPVTRWSEGATSVSANEALVRQAIELS
jgi:hypothetical protein